MGLCKNKKSISHGNLGMVDSGVNMDNVALSPDLHPNTNDTCTVVCNTMIDALFANQCVVFAKMFNTSQDLHLGVGLCKVMGDATCKKCDEL